MKTRPRITVILFIPAILCQMVHCRDKGPGEASATKNRQESMVFSATFTGDYVHAGPDTFPEPRCIDPNAVRVIVKGSGSSVPLNSIRVYFDFCVDSSGNYGNARSFIVSEANDSLFFDCRGQVIEGRLEEHPDDVTSYWKDEFEITGGSGKYAGARGIILTDDYNRSEDVHSHHRWTGTIRLPLP